MTKYRSGNNKYDAIGNPTQYYNGRTYKMTWKGRQLQTLTLSGVTTTFTYNADGLRINKTTGGVSHDYVWSGDMLLAEVTTDYTLRFLYNGSGEIVGFEHITASTTDTDITYYYEKNIFGDVIAIYAENGTKVASYAYNAYGQCHVLTNHTDAKIGSLNPIRYRSYYIDTDIYLYYLQSRYYDTVACRFINADTYINANGDIIGYNMFAYCSNNPVMYTDPTGESALAVLITIGVIAGVAVGLGATMYADYEDDGEVFNGSVSLIEYAANTLMGGMIGGFAGALASTAAPAIGAFLSSSFTFGGYALTSGQMVAITVSGAQIAGAAITAVAGASIVFFSKPNSGRIRFQDGTGIDPSTGEYFSDKDEAINYYKTIKDKKMRQAWKKWLKGKKWIQSHFK